MTIPTTPDDPPALGLLRAWLQEKGLSQNELERRAGLPVGHVSRYFRHGLRPGLHSALQIERVTGVKAEQWETQEERASRATRQPRPRRTSTPEAA